MSSPAFRSVRFVVIHRPGPLWKPGIDFREQEGVQEHIQHYLQFHEQGKLELGGPFLLQDAGGMMVARKDIAQEELEAFAAADPAVRSGLLVFEVRPWLTAIEHRSIEEP